MCWGWIHCFCPVSCRLWQCCEDYCNCYCNICDCRFSKSSALLIMAEVMVNLSSAFCHHIIRDPALMKKININFESTIYNHRIVHLVALASGLFVGWLADSWVGKYIVVMFGLSFALIAPLSALLFRFKSFHRKSLIFSLYAVRYSIACCIATAGTRTALYVEQLDPEEIVLHQMGNYIYVLWMLRCGIDCMTSGLIFTATFYENILFWYNVALCVILPLFFLIILWKKDLIYRTTIKRGLLEKSLKRPWEIFSPKLTYKYCYTTQFISSDTELKSMYLQKRFVQLLVILFPLFMFSISSVLFEDIVKEEGESNDFYDKYRMQLCFTFGLYAMEALMLTVSQFCIIPLFTSFKYCRSCLKAIGTSYTIIAIAGIILSLFTLASIQGFIPSSYFGQLRIYNGVDSEIIIECEWVGSKRLEGGELLVLDMVPCLKICFGEFKVIYNINQYANYRIQAAERKSITYIVEKTDMRRISIDDPILTSEELKTASQEMSTLYIFSNSPNLNGRLIVGDEKAIISLNDREDHQLLPVTIGLQLMEFTHSHHQNDSGEWANMRFEPKGIYSLYIYTIDEETKLFVDPVSVPHFSHSNYNYLWIFISLTITLSNALCKLSVIYFLYQETPEAISSVIHSFAYLNIFCGQIIWIIQGTDTMIGAKIIIVVTWFQCIFIAVFYWISNHYIDNSSDEEQLDNTMEQHRRIQERLRPRRKQTINISDTSYL